MHKHLSAFSRRAPEHPGTPSEHLDRREGVPAQVVVNAQSSDLGTPGTPENKVGWRDFAPLAHDAGGGEIDGNQPEAPAAQGVGSGRRTEGKPATSDEIRRMSVRAPDAKAAPSFADRPADWKPEPSAGVRIVAPAIELDAREYDSRLDIMIAALPEGSAERNRMEFSKKKGWVVEFEGERIYTRGRM